MEYIKKFCGYEDKNKESKYYYLSLIKESHGWSIHGLWPQFTKNSYPTYCKKVEFSFEKLQPIIERLNTLWYSTKEPNEDFWKHEWTKHGSCVFSEMTELEYFEKTIELYKFVISNDLPEKYQVGNKSLIPFDLEFNYLNN